MPACQDTEQTRGTHVYLSGNRIMYDVYFPLFGNVNYDLFDQLSSSNFDVIDPLLIVLVNDFQTHFWPWTPATDSTKHQGCL